jgi:hypothetical protein
MSLGRGDVLRTIPKYRSRFSFYENKASVNRGIDSLGDHRCRDADTHYLLDSHLRCPAEALMVY